MFKLILFLFWSSTTWAGQSEFENFLEKNSTYKALVDNYDSAANPAVKADLQKLSTTFEAYVREKQNPIAPSKAEMVDQSAVDMKNCPTCQNFLNLSVDINKILNKMEKGNDVVLANEATLQLNKLNFLYYVVKYEGLNGGITCNKYGNFDKIHKSKFGGRITLKAEELFDLPNVNEVQYIPEHGKEVVYLYRGTGAQRNVLIEVHMRADGQATIKYFEYAPSSAELMAEGKEDVLSHALEAWARKDKSARPTEANFIELGLGLQTRDKVIPTNIEIMKSQTKFELADDLVLGTRTNLSFNEQKTEVILSDKAGESWLQVNATYKTEGKKELVTLVPLSLQIDEESKLKLGGNLKTELGITNEVVERADTLNLALTDHDHQYINVEFYQRPQEHYSRTTVTNNFNLGQLGDIAMNYSEDSAGEKRFSIGKNTNLGDYGTLKTEFGGGNTTKRYVALQHEMPIGKTTTLSIGARTNSDKQFTTMFQLDSKF